MGTDPDVRGLHPESIVFRRSLKNAAERVHRDPATVAVAADPDERFRISAP